MKTHIHTSPLPAISQFTAAHSLHPPRPAFIPFFSVLHHHFPSNSQLSSTQWIICLKAKCSRTGNQIHITFAFRVSGHKWMVSGSETRQHFHLSFLFLSYTRRRSACKLAKKGEVENNYGSDAPERNESIAWPVMKWKVDKPALCNSEIWMQRKWLFCTVNQREKIANYKCWPSAGT